MWITKKIAFQFIVMTLSLVGVLIFTKAYVVSSDTRYSQARQDINLAESNASPIWSAEEVPLSILDHVRVFVLFIGHARSSHSIVASVLDSHPHMIVSHESGIVTALINSPSTVTKSDVLNCIWTSSYKSAHGGKRELGGKGYNLVVDKEWQGRYDNYAVVFGDDEAQVIPTSLLHGGKAQAMLKRLPSLVGVPIKLFHVIRNPYDNIATEVLYRTFKSRHQVSNTKSSNVSVTVKPEVVDATAHHYFRLYKGVEFVKKEFGFDTMTIHIRDFISNPKSVIAEMCTFLEVVCSEEYINKCSDKIFNNESKTRFKITWKTEQIGMVRSAMQKFDNLKMYEDFNS